MHSNAHRDIPAITTRRIKVVLDSRRWSQRHQARPIHSTLFVRVLFDPWVSRPGESVAAIFIFESHGYGADAIISECPLPVR